MGKFWGLAGTVAPAKRLFDNSRETQIPPDYAPTHGDHVNAASDSGELETHQRGYFVRN